MKSVLESEHMDCIVLDYQYIFSACRNLNKNIRLKNTILNNGIQSSCVIYLILL